MKADTTIKSRFFRAAQARATQLVKNGPKLMNLVNKASSKINRVELKDNVLGQLRLTLRMLKAYVKGSYRNVPWNALISLTTAIVYFVMPLDLIPDIIPITGLVDDFTILLWVFKSFEKELVAFEDWEKSPTTTD